MDFRNVIVIMTSNLGSQQMKAGAQLGFGCFDQSTKSEDDRKKRIHSDVMIEVERNFRPEFPGGLDKAIVFNPLTLEDLQRIVHLQLAEIQVRLTEHDVDLQMTTSAISFLIEKGFHEDHSARPLRRAIERYIEDPLVEHLLCGEFQAGKIWVEKQGEGDDAKLGFSPTEPVPEPEPVQAT